MNQESINPYHTNGQKPPPLEEGTVRPRFELKSPFGPEASDLDPDRYFARKALRGLRSGWNQLQALDSDCFVGLTIHGSSVKGRMHDNSDIDTVVFYDPNFAHDESDGIPSDVNSIATFLDEPAQANMYGQRKVTDRHVVSVTLAPLNEQIITDDLASLHDLYEYEISQIAVVSKLPTKYNDLFGMRIGEGKIQCYRKLFLDELSKHPQSDEIWKHLATTFADVEELNRRKATIYFPDTLEKAYTYFGFERESQVEVHPTSEVDLAEPISAFQLYANGVWRLTPSKTRITVDETHQKSLTDV